MEVRSRLRQGLVIPAHPLALTCERKLDERRQRALSRYYLAAGAGGLAVAVHTTQFAIRNPEFGLLQPVLELAMDEMRGHPVVKIAGVCGNTGQARHEAELAAKLGYDAVLLSMGALRHATVDELILHARAVADVIPVIGFYLQPAVGGRVLPLDFWRRLAQIQNVVAIKIAPFNRYQTIDVIRGVIESGRASDISLYTGNDDNIFFDLLSNFSFGSESVRIAGGLLGHWAVWTSVAVRHLEHIRKAGAAAEISHELTTLAWQVTDANAALFDAANGFHGCIAGLHEILRRQGLLEGRWLLDPAEDLSPGQLAEIDRVCHFYPHLRDDSYVEEHRDEWLR
jgi:dihydrodipicolinate synthase/N-acetylneuraminate lyase